MDTDNFYIAILVYESTSESGDKPLLFEECFVLLRAADEAQARSKALTHAEQASVSYSNVEGETVHWSVKMLLDVKPVLEDKLEDGTVLYARHFRDWRAYHQFEPLLGGSLD